MKINRLFQTNKMIYNNQQKKNYKEQKKNLKYLKQKCKMNKKSLNNKCK